MTNSSKQKGDRAELEVQNLLRDHLGIPCRRALGAGRLDDIGDIHGIPNTVLQVANWKNVTAALRAKPDEAERQRHVAGVDHAATFLRLRGGVWRVALTPEQYFAMWRETL